MVSSEKLAALGFPVHKPVSDAMGLPQPLPVTDPARGDSVCGNSFHFSTAAIMVLLALTCFGPQAGNPPRIDWGKISK